LLRPDQGAVIRPEPDASGGLPDVANTRLSRLR
jgi:hypothetical protein